VRLFTLNDIKSGLSLVLLKNQWTKTGSSALASGARAVAQLLPLLLLVLSIAGCTARRKSACEGLVYKAGGLTRAEYLSCAGEMIGVLDRLRPDLEAAVQGDKQARSKARDEYAELSTLLKSAGGRNLVERWQDEDLTRLNVRIWNAYTSYGAVLLYPNAADLRGAEASHDEAKSVYGGL